ncbi:MAG: hypothetical protein ACYC6T_17500 [Thermoleophilia bacterium]
MSSIDSIPAETRWAVATQALTGAITATNSALQRALSEEEGTQMAAGIWGPAGAASGGLAEALNLPRPTGLAGLWNLSETLIRLTMGPEFKAHVTKSSADRLVARVTSCPWAKRAQEQGVEGSSCVAGDHAWCMGLAEYYGIKIRHQITTAMPLGDEYCTASYWLAG